MTENEAIKMLRSIQNPKVDYADLVCAPAFAYGFKYVYPEPEDYAIETAIKALKEVQEYRKLGTVEDLKSLKENGAFTTSELVYIRCQQMELEKYKEIGTVEECREAAEKQKPKQKIRPKTEEDRYYHEPACPNCGTELRAKIAGYTLSQAIGGYNNCPWCGQKLEEEHE